jgi:hypothetical protein
MCRSFAVATLYFSPISLAASSSLGTFHDFAAKTLHFTLSSVALTSVPERFQELCSPLFLVMNPYAFLNGRT